MTKERKYRIEEGEFKKEIEPKILKNRKKIGRPTKISHYRFFCGILYVLRTGISLKGSLEGSKKIKGLL